MKVFVPVKMAFKNIRSNKMRSILTMLGIIIGVSSVITLVALAQGSTKSVTQKVENLGTNLVTVSIKGRGKESGLDYQKVMQWKQKPGIKAVSPVISANLEVKNGTKKETLPVEGIEPDYQTVQNFHVQQGRFVLPIDVTYRQKVALIGTQASQELFGFVNPVGQKVYLNGIPFTIVGLLEEKGSSRTGSNDDKILIPISTAERIMFTKSVKTIGIQADQPKDVGPVVSTIDNLLNRQFHHDANSFKVFNQQQMLSAVSSVSETMTLMLVGIAAISLLVGGIGIMNIMLVSVTERTKEIGIRKAIGAKKRDILFLFLIEAVVLTAIGGIVGIGTGILGANILSYFVGFHVILSIRAALLAFGFSVFIGVIFGLLPANRAAKLKPIDALRFE